MRWPSTTSFPAHGSRCLFRQRCLKQSSKVPQQCSSLNNAAAPQRVQIPTRHLQFAAVNLFIVFTERASRPANLTGRGRKTGNHIVHSHSSTIASDFHRQLSCLPVSIFFDVLNRL